MSDKGEILLKMNKYVDNSQIVMPESHERILRSIIRRFGSFPTRTYSNRISNDANVRITYEERSGRVLNLIKRAPNLSHVSPYVGVRWQTYGRVTGALNPKGDFCGFRVWL